MNLAKEAISRQKVENADAILLVGSNPRWEASVLNTRIRKAFINNSCKIGLIGPELNLNYSYTNISNSLTGLNDILNNNSEFSKDSEEYKEIIPAIKFLKKK